LHKEGAKEVAIPLHGLSGINLLNYNMGIFSKKANKTSENSAGSAQSAQASKKIIRIPRDVQESIPYKTIYKNGIIEDYDGRFSKSYRLPAANFDTEEDDAQEKVVLAYEKFVNLVTEGVEGQLTIINRTISQDDVRNNIMMKPKNDPYNKYREIWNNIFLDNLAQGKNNIVKDKVFTVSVPADNIIEANDILKRMDTQVAKTIKKSVHQDVTTMTIDDRLHLLYDIYNYNSGFSFEKKVTPITENGKIDLDKLSKYGISSKDVIGPDWMHFGNSDFQIGDNSFCKAFYLDHLPSQLSTSILNDLSNLSCNMITSVTYTQMDQQKAKSLIKNKLTSLNSNIAGREEDDANKGISNSSISSELENARDEAKNLMDDIVKRDMKIFQATVLMIVMADSKEELASQCAVLKSIASGHLCQLRVLGKEQEDAFDMALPLAQRTLPCNRVLTTEQTSVFIPFTVQDLNQENGIWYGKNPLSGNMIRYNRKTGNNYNGIVFGGPGSGKSFLIKEEISQRFLNSDDHIVIIDPEGEYVPLGKALGATIVDIAINSKMHINPLDMDMLYDGEGSNPIPMKCDSIQTLIEAMIGEDMISPVEKSIIQRIGREVYKSYYSLMQTKAQSGITCDKAAMPTLQDFHSLLLKDPDPAAQYLALELEPYCVGNLNVFANRTNVNTDNRFIIYNMKNMTGGLKQIAMHVCMNDSWNRIIENDKNGIYTALYIDEFHLFTKTRTSASFMKDIYKRARKRKGMPLAITQDISDMFVNDESQAIVTNSDFVIMMNQSAVGRSSLADLFNISPNLLEYVTDQLPGNGLVYNGTTTVPFENEFPEDNELFKLMDSRHINATEENVENSTPQQ
jgi:type IV secretory pathway VirB4 component